MKQHCGIYRISVDRKSRSSQTKAAIGRAQAWKHTPEGRAKMSAAAKGRFPSKETRAKMSASSSFRNLPKEAYEKGAKTRELKRMTLKQGSAWVLYG